MKKISEILNIRGFKRFSINTNNYCNLHCEYCSYLCNTPISEKAENIWRRKKREITTNEIITYCERFKDIDVSETELTGGEVTKISIEKFNKIINIFNFYNKKVNLLTNGYNLLNINPKIINKIGIITLDDHGINHEHLNECIKYLGSFYQGEIRRWRVKTHFDLKPAMKALVNNKKKPCNRWLTIPAVYEYTVFPCCNMPAMMILDNSNQIKNSLTEAGWTLKNRNIINVMRNWKKTIPSYVMNQCLNNCWVPNEDVGQDRRLISLKPNDEIRNIINDNVVSKMKKIKMKKIIPVRLIPFLLNDTFQRIKKKAIQIKNKIRNHNI